MTATVLMFPRVEPALAPAPAPDIVASVEYWLARDDRRARLTSALRPPVEWIDDEVYDVVLAVLFRDMVLHDDSWLARVERLRTALAMNTATIAAMRGRIESDADLYALLRIERLSLRLCQWILDIVDGRRA